MNAIKEFIKERRKISDVVGIYDLIRKRVIPIYSFKHLRRKLEAICRLPDPHLGVLCIGRPTQMPKEEFYKMGKELREGLTDYGFRVEILQNLIKIQFIYRGAKSDVRRIKGLESYLKGELGKYIEIPEKDKIAIGVAYPIWQEEEKKVLILEDEYEENEENRDSYQWVSKLLIPSLSNKYDPDFFELVVVSYNVEIHDPTSRIDLAHSAALQLWSDLISGKTIHEARTYLKVLYQDKVEVELTSS